MYLFTTPFSRYVKKTHADQSIYKFFYDVSKERTNKPSKVAASKFPVCSSF